MSRIIAICNQKGGVGKTTTTVSLGAELVRNGFKVLVVDADQQANLTYALGIIEPDELKTTIADLMRADIDGDDSLRTEDVIVSTEDGVDLLPSSVALAGIELPLISAVQREFIIKRIIGTVKNNYDYVLIDCPPSLGLITINILAAADSVLIPVNAGVFSLAGMEQMFKTISLIKKKLNPTLAIEGIVFTMTDTRTIICQQIIATVKETYGKYIKVFDSCIPTSIKAVETVTKGISVTNYEPNSKVALGYANLVTEIIEILKHRNVEKEDKQ